MNDDWASGKGFFSRMFYTHLNPVLELAKKPNRKLQVDDLPQVPEGFGSADSATKLERSWNAVPKDTRPGANTQLYKSLYATFGREFIKGGLWKIPNDAAQFCQPILLKLLLQFVSSPEGPLDVKQGFMIVAAMSALTISTSLFVQWYFQVMFSLSFRVRAALMSMVFRKSLAMSAESKASTNEGETANLMSVDASKITDFIPYAHSLLWSLPLQIITAIVLLFTNVGLAALAGIAVMVLLIPLSAKLNSIQQGYQRTVMKIKDERISTMNELLLGIRVVKFYAWEEPIVLKIAKLRDREKSVMFKRNLVAAFQAVFFACTPVWVTISLFSVYVGVLGNSMAPDVVFPTLVTVNLLRLPLMMLPGLMPALTAAKQSLNRINSYLSKEELQTGVVSIPPKTDSLFDPSREPPSIKIKEAFFGWTKDERDALLKNINVAFPAGKLTAVVGKTGSGKSSLILALLGEMHMSKGSISNYGSVAYASQQAWIQNATVRDNILFGKPFDQSRYNAVIEACSLSTDLAMFANGDMTEIGEQGVNMSGGQKQRLNIARAIYNGGDVYIFDDPLSAVDSHVGEHIFEQCLIRYLASTTRILVTHKIDILPRCDHIIVLDDTGGRVKAQGNFQSLKDQRIDFETTLQHAQQELSAFDSDGDDDAGAEVDGVVGNLDVVASATTPQNDSTNADAAPTSRKLSSDGPTSRKLSSDGTAARRRSKSEKDEKTAVPAKPEKKSGALIEEEKRAEGSDVWKLVKQYSNKIGSRNVCLMTLLLFSLASSQRFADYWLSQWTANPDSATHFGYYVGVYGMLAIVTACVSFLNSAFSSSFELKAASSLHDGMLGSVVRSPMSFFDTTPAGRILNRFSKDQDTLDTSLPANFNSMLSFGFMVFGTLITIGAVLPTFFVCLPPIGWLYYRAAQSYRPFSREIKRLISVVRSPVFSCFGEALHGASTIRAYGARSSFVSKVEKLSDICNRVDMQNSLSNRWIACRLDCCANMFVAFTALSAVTARIYQGPGSAAAQTGMALTMVIGLSGILSWLIRIYAELEGSLNSLERVAEYTELHKEAAANMPDDPDHGWLTRGRIEFKDVVMSYREGLPPVLNGVNFTIEGGKKVGVVGRTGAGKSSLIVAIYRFAEITSGHITVDHRNIHLLGLKSLRSALTIVPQEPVLFSGSVKFNLDPFSEFKDSDMWSALEAVELHTYVKQLGSSMPGNELDAIVSEGGSNFSVGQRQLLCLARALMRHSKILLLDEATAAIDMETDESIQKTIRKQCTNCTVIAIAHRLQTIMDFDEVIVMGACTDRPGGKVLEKDSPKNLLHNHNSVFYGMVQESQKAAGGR